jgi:hypothetical protein
MFTEGYQTSNCLPILTAVKVPYAAGLAQLQTCTFSAEVRSLHCRVAATITTIIKFVHLTLSNFDISLLLL